MSAQSIGLWTLLEIALFGPTRVDYANRNYWETSLLNDLLSPTGPNKYDKFIPALKPPINITPVIQIEHLETLDEKHQVMSMTGSLLVKWKDSRLKWNSSAYGNIHAFSKTRGYLKAAKLEPYIPKLFVTELFARTADLLMQDPTTIQITSNGLIYVAVKFQIRTTCHFFYDRFPNDEQNCSVIFYTPAPISQVHINVLSYAKKSPTRQGTNQLVHVGQWQFTDFQAKTMYLLPGSIKIEDPRPHPPSLVRSVGYYNFRFKRIDAFYNVRMANPVFGISLVMLALSLVRSPHIIRWLCMLFIIEFLIVTNMMDGLPVDYDCMPAVAFAMTLTIIQTILIILWKLLYMHYEQNLPESKTQLDRMTKIDYYYRYTVPLLIFYDYYIIYWSFL